jgi:hypothetical protein
MEVIPDPSSDKGFLMPRNGLPELLGHRRPLLQFLAISGAQATPERKVKLPEAGCCPPSLYREPLPAAHPVQGF